ncbi:MAG: glycosyltransferase family 1 protein [Bacteroidota bacterium]
MKNKLDGIGWFSYQTLKRLCLNHPDVHFIFLFDRKIEEEFIFSNNITPLVVLPQARHPFLYYWWFQWSLKGLVNKIKPDVFLSPDGFLILGAKCKQLPVIHDINFLHYPKDLKPLTARYYNYFFPKFAKAATRIATVSEFSKNEITKHYGIDADKIDVVYNGINDFVRVCSETEKTNTRFKYSQGEDYFLHVGSLSPRKNIGNIIKAFVAFKKESASKMKLVLAGANFWGLASIHEEIKKQGLEAEVIFTGRLPNEELALVLGSAKALVFMSYYEGFGIPLLEAMEAEVPIICSNISALPEIAGDAAILVDPFNSDNIKDAMQKLMADKNLQKDLIQKGQLQKQKFSWDKSAALLWESILKCVKA